MTTSHKHFSFGQQIIHAARPEWGVGTITAARSETQNGQACQRLTVRFERVGLKNLSTAHAELLPAEEAERPAEAEAQPEAKGWLASLEKGDPAETMAQLPAKVKDPFLSLPDRIKTTLDLYRFTDEGAPLLDWASVQTGLKDPLSRFSRHELEVHFHRYALNRDEHLLALLRDIPKTDAEFLQKVLQSAPPGARQALRRFNLSR